MYIVIAGFLHRLLRQIFSTLRSHVLWIGFGKWRAENRENLLVKRINNVICIDLFKTNMVDFCHWRVPVRVSLMLLMVFFNKSRFSAQYRVLIWRWVVWYPSLHKSLTIEWTIQFINFDIDFYGVFIQMCFEKSSSIFNLINDNHSIDAQALAGGWT